MTVTLQWRDSPNDHLRMLSPIGLRLIDELTGATPIGQVSCVLSFEDPPGNWRPTDVKAKRNASGIIIFPGLGRTRDVDVTPPRHYRRAHRAGGCSSHTALCPPPSGR